jgi:hypothetical protein
MTMTRRYLKLAMLSTLFTLSACAQQSEVRQMHESVSTLSKEMTQLNQQTVKITQQNALNAKSSSGVYLCPAPGPRRLESQIGTLRMSLRDIAADADGTRLTLRIQGNQTTRCRRLAPPSPGAITGTTQNYQEVNVHDQLISAPASILAPSDVDIPLRLNGVTPEQLASCAFTISSPPAHNNRLQPGVADPDSRPKSIFFQTVQ